MRFISVPMISLYLVVTSVWAGPLTTGPVVSPAVVEPPAISTLMKPEIYKRVTQNRDMMTHAVVDSAGKSGGEDVEKYSFYSVMTVHAAMNQAYRVLTDYPLYLKMIPYVDKAEFTPDGKTLWVEGGIWKWRLRSAVQFHEHAAGDKKWVHYEIVAGHFRGLSGNILFERLNGQGRDETLVYFNGEVTGSEFPPHFVIERGAEIVFGFTANRMRSYIESLKNEKLTPGPNPNHDSKEIPQPRSHL